MKIWDWSKCVQELSSDWNEKLVWVSILHLQGINFAGDLTSKGLKHR